MKLFPFIDLHCVKSVQIRSFFWSVFACIWTRKNSVFGHFSRSAKYGEILDKVESFKKLF